jgi:NADH:ubiquinone oxidoreductase subunit 6 (subunit J)
MLKLVSILTAAILVGTMFLEEAKKAQAERKAWYTPYASVPGALILLCLFLPILAWIINKISG